MALQQVVFFFSSEATGSSIRTETYAHIHTVFSLGGVKSDTPSVYGMKVFLNVLPLS